jgi:hypothetical protein
VVEGGGPLCYYIHTVSLSTLRCSNLKPLLGSPPCTRMAAETKHDVVTGEQGSPAAGDSTKRRKPKGAHHAFHWEALEDPNVRAENGWKDEKEEYWSSKMCKKYVKMCHIDKLWPKECHAVHTKGFACRPYTCKDDHFIHRAEEVWRALFGNRERQGVIKLWLGGDGLCGVEIGAQGELEHISNDNAISTMYWEDNKGYSRHVYPGVHGDQRDFGIFEEETGRDYRAGLVK